MAGWRVRRAAISNLQNLLGDGNTFECLRTTPVRSLHRWLATPGLHMCWSRLPQPIPSESMFRVIMELPKGDVLSGQILNFGGTLHCRSTKENSTYENYSYSLWTSTTTVPDPTPVPSLPAKTSNSCPQWNFDHCSHSWQ